MRSKPVTKPFSFFDGPFTFELVNDEAIFVQIMQNGGWKIDVVAPIAKQWQTQGCCVKVITIDK